MGVYGKGGSCDDTGLQFACSVYGDDVDSRVIVAADRLVGSFAVGSARTIHCLSLTFKFTWFVWLSDFRYISLV